MRFHDLMICFHRMISIAGRGPDSGGSGWHMRTFFILLLLASLQAIRAQEASRSSVRTDSAARVTQPRIIKPGTSNTVADKERPAVKGEGTANAKCVALSLSLDAKAERFGGYDQTVIAAIQNRWRDLLDSMNYDGSSTGKVVLQFELNQDGRITELKFAEKTVGEMLALLCEKAVLDPSPFPRWPKEMRKQIAANSRTMKITFHYGTSQKAKPSPTVNH